MAGDSQGLRAMLARAVLDAAARRSAELTDYLAGRRLQLLRSEAEGPADEGETPI
jgi:hypothetical protein